MKRVPALLLMIALCVGCLLHCGVCHAEVQCPWLNAATAGGFLGGEVKAKISAVTVDGDATCEFVRGEDSRVFMLQIAVHTMAHPSQEYTTYLAQCGGTAIALRGIGNEAVRCVVADGGAKGEERIVGRVRDRAFIITIRADWIKQPPTSTTKTRNPISDDSENIAEQVAGSMF